MNNKSATSLKAYQAPSVKVLGDIRQITKSTTGTGKTADGGGGKANKTA